MFGDLIWVKYYNDETSDQTSVCLAKVLDVKLDRQMPKIKIEYWYFAYNFPFGSEEVENSPCVVCKALPVLEDGYTPHVICDDCGFGGCLTCFELDAVPTQYWCCGRCPSLPSAQDELKLSDKEWTKAKVTPRDLILDNDYLPEWVDLDTVQDIIGDPSSWNQRLMYNRPKLNEDGHVRRRARLSLIPKKYLPKNKKSRVTTH
mmetsp:Transcript_12898/g.51898  ORF Transcript_12898/g.51898 Transcript_12898/m.51898 type:complete len:203 (+) Transcript_12898:1868-2476(+)